MVRARFVAGAAALLGLGGLAPALLPGAAAAQEVTFGGQIRPRLEGRDPSTPDGPGQAFTSMRTRVSVAAALRESVRAFVQLQDVRLFGEEASTLADHSADGLDVHQAWVELGAEEDVLGLRVGRQEASYGGQRLVGAVDWTQQARAFDGARARFGEPGARLRLDAFAFQLSESAAPARERDAAFLGGYAVVDAGPGQAVDLYLLWDREEAGDADTDQGTAGARWVGGSGPLDWRLEGAWQFGERGGRDVGAWFVGARAGAELAGGASITLWYDHLSGDDPVDEGTGVFSTLFATNHKFYGYADLFLDVPAHTAGRGLRDAAIKASWTPAPGWTVGLDLHHLRVAHDAGLQDGHLANEGDLTVGYTLARGARATGGLSYVDAGDALASVRGIAGDVRFGYMMLDVVF